MTVTTKDIQANAPSFYIPEGLPSGRVDYHYEERPDSEDALACDVCGAEPETGHEPRIVYTRRFSLCLCPRCTEKMVSSLIQDLARVVEKEGFVVGRWLASREQQITKDMEEILFSGRVLTAPTGS